MVFEIKSYSNRVIDPERDIGKTKLETCFEFDRRNCWIWFFKSLKYNSNDFVGFTLWSKKWTVCNSKLKHCRKNNWQSSENEKKMRISPISRDLSSNFWKMSLMVSRDWLLISDVDWHLICWKSTWNGKYRNKSDEVVIFNICLISSDMQCEIVIKLENCNCWLSIDIKTSVSIVLLWTPSKQILLWNIILNLWVKVELILKTYRMWWSQKRVYQNHFVEKFVEAVSPLILNEFHYWDQNNNLIEN